MKSKNLKLIGLAICLISLSGCSGSSTASGCNSSADSGDVPTRLNACASGWSETRARDPFYSTHTVYGAPNDENCTVWMMGSTNAAKSFEDYLMRTRSLAYRWIGTDEYSGEAVLALSESPDSICGAAIQNAFGAQLQ